MSDDRDTLPVARTKTEAKASYDRLSRFYDLISGHSEKKFIEAGLLLLDAQRGEKVLEVGFGTGDALVSLARTVGRDGRVSGIDISSGMLAVARGKLEKAGLAGRVELETGDAASLAYEGESFDAVLMNFSLDLIDTAEIPVVLEECLRVLVGGGRICVVSMSNLGTHGAMMRLYLWGHKHMPKLVDCRPIYTMKSLENAGFEVADESLMSMWGLPVEIVLAKKPFKPALFI
jgi:ubiquinone/menaquinone biosynthesis C-methylase UbiE